MQEWLKTLDWGQIMKVLKGKKKTSMFPGVGGATGYNSLHCPVKHRA